MTASRLGVGIVGVSPSRGWAATAHIPALRALPNFEIRALSGRTAEAARAAGEQFGVRNVFTSHEDLVAHPDVDVVVVTVRAPRHRELVGAALAAGKAVYCEWPLGRDLGEARDMAALAATKGVRTVVGLQGRQAPAIELARHLVSEGYVGEVLSTTMIGVSVAGASVGQPNAYMLEKSNGANVLSIAVGHSVDALNYVLGEFVSLSAMSDLRRPTIILEDSGEQVHKTAPDQIAIIGSLESSTTVSVHIRESVAGGTGFMWEINGTRRDTAVDCCRPVPRDLSADNRRSTWGKRTGGAGDPCRADAEVARTGRARGSARVQRRAHLRRVRGGCHQRHAHGGGLR
ncbi:MAG: hypothetical protein QOC60_284 [Frankiaceae bacterium]|nr:hypothetical protein [Frankiaceae bacterium]